MSHCIFRIKYNVFRKGLRQRDQDTCGFVRVFDHTSSPDDVSEITSSECLTVEKCRKHVRLHNVCAIGCWLTTAQCILATFSMPKTCLLTALSFFFLCVSTLFHPLSISSEHKAKSGNILRAGHQSITSTSPHSPTLALESPIDLNLHILWRKPIKQRQSHLGPFEYEAIVPITKQYTVSVQCCLFCEVTLHTMKRTI